MKRLTLLLCLTMFSCSGSVLAPEEFSPHGEAMFEAWDPEDSPSAMLELHMDRLQDLPRAGRATSAPWPGNHWAMHLDGINYRWQGDEILSPAEKFAAAFGVSDFPDRASAYLGIGEYLTKPCTRNEQCDPEELCATRRGATEGFCVGEWWGVCDGWSAAAILVPEPQVPVVRHGVTFMVNDIKALVSTVYRSYDHRAMGWRNNDRELSIVDADGRPVEEVYRSMNPGGFHLLLGNHLGHRQTAFVIDRDPTFRVFNQPVWRYEVEHLGRISQKRAARLVGARDGTYPHNDRAQTWYHVRTRIFYIADPEHFIDGPLLGDLEQYEIPMLLDYVLELDGEGAIIGGEWVGASRLHHPDFAWAVTDTDATAIDFPTARERRLILELARASNPQASTSGH